MNKKIIAIIAGAAALGGYGVSRYIASKSKAPAAGQAEEPAPQAEKDRHLAESGCPSCGKPVKEYEFFCPYCGYTFEARRDAEE